MKNKLLNKIKYLYLFIVGFVLIFYKDLENLSMGINNNLNYIKCGSAENIPRPFPQITSIAYALLLVGTPLVLITFSIITLVKANAAGNADEIDKAKKNLFKKFVIAAIIFFVFFIVQFVINRFSSNDEDRKSAASCLKCFLYYSSESCGTSDPMYEDPGIRIKKSNTSNYVNSNIKSNPNKSNKSNNNGPTLTNSTSGWQQGTYGRIKYLLYVPPKVPSSKPLILQLHGAAECGKDYSAFDSFGFKQKTDKGKEINAYILMPIIPTYTSWIDYDKEVFELTEKVVEEQGIDKNKITISGVSLGGEGVSAYLEKHPGYFANAILIARHNPISTDTFRKVHTWIVWGDKDTYASPNSPNMYNQLNKAGCDVRKTVAPGVGHDPVITGIMIEDSGFDSFINQTKIQ